MRLNTDVLSCIFKLLLKKTEVVMNQRSLGKTLLIEWKQFIKFWQPKDPEIAGIFIEKQFKQFSVILLNFYFIFSSKNEQSPLRN